VVCCSYDLRVCDFACDLYKQGAAESIVFSGNTGNWTSKLWAKEEAYIFQEIALANGVPKSKIITEPVATNLGENLSLSRALLPDVDSVTFVTKPNTLLRVKLTKEVKWNQIKAKYSAPKIRFPLEVSNIVGLFGLISEMTGDLQRIIEYPKLGYQAEIELPEEVLESYEYLIAEGFDSHLIKNRNY